MEKASLWQEKRTRLKENQRWKTEVESWLCFSSCFQLLLPKVSRHLYHPHGLLFPWVPQYPSNKFLFLLSLVWIGFLISKQFFKRTKNIDTNIFKFSFFNQFSISKEVSFCVKFIATSYSIMEVIEYIIEEIFPQAWFITIIGDQNQSPLRILWENFLGWSRLVCVELAITYDVWIGYEKECMLTTRLSDKLYSIDISHHKL